MKVKLFSFETRSGGTGSAGKMFQHLDKMVKFFLEENPQMVIHDIKMSNFGTNFDEGHATYFGVVLLQYD